MAIPLRPKTMTLEELQDYTLRLIRLTRGQLNRSSWEDGMTDGEFEEQVLDVLATKITNDQYVLKIQEGK